MEFLTGLATGVIGAGLVALALEVVRDHDSLLELLRRRRNFEHIRGDWYQYHLTNDRTEKNYPVWTFHREIFSLDWLGRVRGTSDSQYKTRLSYRIVGKVTRNKLLLEYRNSVTHEEPTLVYIENFLSGEFLQGIWIGHDYNQAFSVGPIFYSRARLLEEELKTMLGKFAFPDPQSFEATELRIYEFSA